MAALVMSIFLLPALYVWFARDSDSLPPPPRPDHPLELKVAQLSKTGSAIDALITQAAPQGRDFRFPACCLHPAG